MSPTADQQVNELFDELDIYRDLRSEGRIDRADYQEEVRCIWARIRLIDRTRGTENMPAPRDHWRDEEQDTFE